MKEFLVIVGGIILGVVLVSVLLKFKEPAEKVGTETVTKMDGFADMITNG